MILIYVSDGTVLDMIWKTLKAGYMEDEIRYETASGTQQGANYIKFKYFL